MKNSSLIMYIILLFICVVIASLSMPFGFIILDTMTTDAVMNYCLMLLPLVPLTAFCVFLMHRIRKR